MKSMNLYLTTQRQKKEEELKQNQILHNQSAIQIKKKQKQKFEKQTKFEKNKKITEHLNVTE